jgi:hypothetical protein
VDTVDTVVIAGVLLVPAPARVLGHEAWHRSPVALLLAANNAVKVRASRATMSWRFSPDEVPLGQVVKPDLEWRK